MTERLSTGWLLILPADEATGEEAGAMGSLYDAIALRSGLSARVNGAPSFDTARMSIGCRCWATRGTGRRAAVQQSHLSTPSIHPLRLQPPQPPHPGVASVVSYTLAHPTHL